DTCRQSVRNIVNYLHRERVSSVKSLHQCSCRDLLDFASRHLQNCAAKNRIGLHTLMRSASYGPSAGQCFHASPVAAMAKRTVKVHRHMPDLPRCVAAPFKHPAAADDPSTDSRPDKDTHQIGGAHTSPEKPFAPQCGPNIVGYYYGNCTCLLHFRLKRHVMPVQVGREHDGPGPGVHLPGHTDA